MIIHYQYCLVLSDKCTAKAKPEQDVILLPVVLIMYIGSILVYGDHDLRRPLGCIIRNQEYFGRSKSIRNNLCAMTLSLNLVMFQFVKYYINTSIILPITIDSSWNKTLNIIE